MHKFTYLLITQVRGLRGSDEQWVLVVTTGRRGPEAVPACGGQVEQLAPDTNSDVESRSTRNANASPTTRWYLQCSASSLW